MRKFTLAELESLPTIKTGSDGSQLKIETDTVKVYLLGHIALIKEFQVPFFGVEKRWFLTQAIDLRGPTIDPETFEAG